MRISDITSFLEAYAPPLLQENYDNAGLITGNPDWEVKGVLLCLDSTEEVLDEAIAKGCNLVVAHHPIIFSGLKKITGRTYVERVIIKAIRNDIGIFAAHTNLDNVRSGVNDRIADMLGLGNRTVLAPRKGFLKKLFTYVPLAQKEALLQALFDAGAGNIGNYSECSFSVEGTGSFKGSEESDPFVGERGKRHYEQESRVEVIFPAHVEGRLIHALRENHPYEEVAFDVIRLDNDYPGAGSGMSGDLPSPISEKEFLGFLKERMKAHVIRHTALTGREIRKVALCGGSGSFLLKEAMAAGADAFVTADFKYHQFFDAEGKILIADIGHYESEQFTINLFYDLLRKKFGNFAVYLTEKDTNPVKYF